MSTGVAMPPELRRSAVRAAVVHAVRWALLLVVAWLLFRYVRRHWEAVRQMDLQVDVPHLILGIAVTLSSTLFQVGLFRYFLRHCGVTLTARAAWRVYCLPQLGKYVPGRIASMVASTYLLKREGLSVTHALAAITVFMVAGILAGFICGMLFLPGALGVFSPLAQVSLVTACVLLVLAFCSRFVWSCLNILLRWCRRPTLTQYPGSVVMITFLVGSVVRWAIYGYGYFELARGVFPLAASEAPLMIAAITVSHFVGMLAIFAPAGIGVREGLLITMLDTGIGPGFATLYAAFSRLAMVVTDVLMIGSAWLLGRHDRPASPVATAVSAPGTLAPDKPPP
jgi:uncharacterized membrane protein YbhN (UPF0104 family)